MRNNSRTVLQNSGFSNSKANIPLRNREGMEDGMDDLYGNTSFRGDSGWEEISTMHGDMEVDNYLLAISPSPRGEVENCNSTDVQKCRILQGASGNT